MAEIAIFSQAPKIEQRKRRRRRKHKVVCLSAQKNCSRAELLLILAELDGDRAIKRTADGRRVRTQVAIVTEQPEASLESLNSKKERKLKNLLVASYLEKSHDYINNKNKIESLVLPIEQMLALVEVIA